MVLAEVKREDDSEWEVKLFNMSLSQFRSMANKRYVAIGRIMNIEDVAYVLARSYGWV